MNRKTKHSFLQLLVFFTFLLQSTASFSMNAYVTVTYFNESSNYTKTERCECGVYGLVSLVANAMGVVGIPKNGNYQACDYNTEFTNTAKPWIALIERGNCTFSEKIQTASRSNANAVVIYNSPETGNQTIQMANFGAGDIVAIMIGNLKGTKILQSIQRGIQVTMVIEVGKKHGPWVNHYSIFFVSVSFFIITAATVGYFIFYSARRLRNARAQSRKQRQLKADAKKAIGKLQLRTLKQGDKEIGPDGDSCAVCIELYKPNDLVRILTCNHIFHKTCVDPWLLEHRTCPMCKCDILKALGIEVDVEDGSVSLQVPVSNEASNTASPHEEDSRSETASSGYASVQGADEPPLEEHAQSANENLQLVNHEANSVAVDVVPHVDNPTFEEDETPDQEAAVREIKS
ncbi:E3 ubiquitin-protein ligase RNF128 isoform 2 [Mus musculus]|uniref:Ring finger protein 128 n=1 Tax=Mus musculus TaxID=10090 RepID=A2AGL8_MOUSE|nr:E3 ubiquitin-protein ligase RNF128 isoform 2 precursor [Mus musculus]|eukprot:NP_001241690.1 E3 ubiquitin-protein ligase RNF128 isoform 2 precursor [Mus musculus]